MSWITKAVETVRWDRQGFECDKCGVTHKDSIEMQEAVTINIFGGYGSVFGDGSELEAVLCQTCAKGLLGPFLKEMP